MSSLQDRSLYIHQDLQLDTCVAQYIDKKILMEFDSNSKIFMPFDISKLIALDVQDTICQLNILPVDKYHCIVVVGLKI